MPSRVRVEGPIPRERMPHGEIVHPDQPFAPGSLKPPQPGPTPQPTKTGSIFLYPGERSTTQNISGNEITLLDLNDLNPALAPVIYSFPGGGADRNNCQWVVAVPSDVADNPNWRIRFHVLGQAAE